MTLEMLVTGTEFTHGGRKYRKGTHQSPNPKRDKPDDLTQGYLCEPFLGGRFQIHKELLVWIARDAKILAT